MIHRLAWLLPLLACTAAVRADEPASADLIIHHAKIVTLNAKDTIAEAIAVKGDRIIAVGDDATILKQKGPKTRVIDAEGRMVMPGLYDSHVHPLGAATSEAERPLPLLRSLKEVFAHIRKEVETLPEGDWIVIQYAFPTRLEEERFPTKAELDAVAPKHPVLYHAGPAGVVNTAALKISGITKDTPDPRGGSIVKDTTTGEPTGMIRNAYQALKGVPRPGDKLSADAKREAVAKLFSLYNEHGITSVADRNADRESLDIYLTLQQRKELSVRVNVARSFSPYGTREEVAKRFDDLPGKDKRGGPTGVGDEWVHIGPIKLFLDGGMLNGTAYMRQPWPKGDTYQVTTDNYRGLLFIPPEQLQIVLEEGAKRKWQMTAHTAGEGAMDVLLDAYDVVDRQVPIKDMRWCITHANFPSQRNLEICKRLGVCADVQPAWLYKDGALMARLLGADRVRWFQPYHTWLEYTTIGGGSDHMIRLDPLDATNPWDPWLGIWITLSRATERGHPVMPDEKLTRNQALRLYTINNAYLHHEEKDKGSLEAGKLADLIVIDRDVLTCPMKEVAGTKVLRTIVGGKQVFEQKP
jgi:predicted amidohydrolase YtcJ